MEGLPLLPGFSFRDPTQTKHNVNHLLDFKNGYALNRPRIVGVGQKPLDTSSVIYAKRTEPLRYDPSLTYGRVKQPTFPIFKPHFLLYDKKCLQFKAFFRQSVAESPNETYRVRHVNIMYFLEDDSITVMEPPVRNAGFLQGRLVKRSRIPKNDRGEFYHWKDFNVGIDLAIFGIVYHICSCDGYTREYLISQGVELNEPETMPLDPYLQNRALASAPTMSLTPTLDDKLRRFLEFDGKVLRFFTVWDDSDTENGEMRPYVIRYYLATDEVDIGEVHEANSGRDPFPLLLTKMKQPKNWNDVPANYPAAYLEKGDEEVVEYYQPKDFIIGNTVFIMARRFFIYDCDAFTRKYYAMCLRIDQPPAISVKLPSKKKTYPPPRVPPHIGIGAPEDTIQSCYSFMPKPPKKDVLRFIINSGKRLRYSAKMESVHPEDSEREFVIEYCLADGKVVISELQIRNSGFLGGRFLSPQLLPKPGTDRDNPEYYTPADFDIGGVVNVYGHRFKITNADLKVYRYMEANREKFSSGIVENYRSYFLKQGMLKDDINEKINSNANYNDDCVEADNEPVKD